MAASDPLSKPKVRNPHTQARIRRDVFWQIGLPLALVLFGLVSAGVWVVLPQGAATRSPIADVSLTFLICPASLMGLMTLAILGGAVYGLFYGLRELPYLFKQAQDILVLVTYYTQKYARQVANVFLSTRAGLAAGQRTTEQIWAMLDRRRQK